MFVEIEKLIFKLRKEVYKDLAAGKPVMPKAYFFVDSGAAISEIIIPGAERFFETGFLKELLSGYVRQKWQEYKGKVNSTLVAVMIMSDQWYVERKATGMSKGQMEKMATTITPRLQPDRAECISFMVYTESERRSFVFKYSREGRKIHWADKIEDMEMGDVGRFKDMFPKNV